MKPNQSNYPSEHQGLALVLAIAMHLLLLGLLLFSVQWKTKQPDPVVVELWGAPPPAPVRQSVVEAKPVRKVVAKVEPQIDPVKAPDVVTEKIKAKPTPTVKPTPIPTAKPTPTPSAKPTAKPSAKPTVQPTPVATAKPSVVVPPPAKASAAPKKAEVKKPKSELESALGFDNLLGADTQSKPNPNAKAGGKVGGTGDTVGATGGAGKGKGSGVGEGYARGVGQDIKQKIVYTPGNQNPRVTYKIHLLPSGEIRQIELIKASGDPKWDEAVKRAIQLYAPFPKPPAGATFNDYRDIRWEFAPKE
ncbi:cell envelope integrity protein TolA [uncultured Deefgea sp.]|uniref:cell envelope integrity protein TolA n=1 Tax=uncultured Deefgea sp. TaxID=1304914 RepID=UPI002598465D|nr:cell envelope integrity protein TolA [uncultured Deefgea sp.]